LSGACEGDQYVYIAFRFQIITGGRSYNFETFDLKLAAKLKNGLLLCGHREHD